MEGYKNITKIFHVILIYIDFATIYHIFPLEKYTTPFIKSYIVAKLRKLKKCFFWAYHIK